MPDNTELMDKFEIALWQWIALAKNDGLKYRELRYIIEETLKQIELQSYCEDWWRSNK